MVQGSSGKPKLKEKERAVELRKKGYTYSEILKEVPVAKSTLSLWLGEVGLTQKQKQHISEKRRAAQLRGAAARHQQRKELVDRIYSVSEKEIGKLSKRELWLIGIALYWAEGTKEKEWRSGSGVQFANSDPNMIRLFLAWLLQSCNVPRDDIYLALYIHQTAKDSVPSVEDFWFRETGFRPKCTYFKKHTPKMVRKNVSSAYNGLIAINVYKSSTLTRKIAGWTRGIVKDIPKAK